MNLSKISILIKVLKYVYSLKPVHLFFREFLLIVIVLSDLIAIKIGGNFIDSTYNFITNTNSFTFLGFISSDSFFYLCISLGLLLISYCSSQIREYINDKVYRTIISDIKQTHIDKISKLNLADIESKEFRDVLTLSIHFGPQQVWGTYKTATSILQNLITGITALVILFEYVGIYSLIVTILALPEAIVGYVSRKKIKKYHDKGIEKIKWSDYVESLTTQITSFPELKVDGTIGSLKKEYQKTSDDFVNGITELVKHQFIDTSLFGTLSKVFFYIFLTFAIYISVIKRFTIGTFKVIYDYGQMVYSNFLAIFEAFFVISNQLDYAVNFFKVSEFKGFGDISHGEVKLKRGTPLLKFANLDFTYPDGNEKVLENLNFEANPGERIMIIGDDGSGKSSLVKVFCGLHRIIAGDYEIDGYSIRELQRGELKRKLSVIFQDFINYNTTLRKNITIASQSTVFNESLYNQALKISGIDKLMKRYSVRENQMLGKFVSGGKDVSSGFWQRIAIARMVYRNREIFLLDEPFTHIDDAEEQRIMKEFFEFVGVKRTIIFISRDNRHREFFDKIYRLDKGKLIRE